MLQIIRCVSLSFLTAVAALAQTAPASGAALRTVRPGVSAGKVEKLTLQDPIYNKTRRIWVYTPAGYDAARKEAYDFVLCFDGDSYVADDEMKLPTVLDNLLADGKIRPPVVAMLDNGSGAERLADLGNRKDFVKFVGETLVPWARSNYAITRDPAHVLVTGYSAGGIGASYVAFMRPDLFGNVLSQSGAVWRGAEASNAPPYEWLTEQVASAPKKPVRFYMEVGALETQHVLGGAGPVFIEANRNLRDALRKKGYEVQYKEIPNAQHEMGHWRDQIAEGLVYLMGR